MTISWIWRYYTNPHGGAAVGQLSACDVTRETQGRGHLQTNCQSACRRFRFCLLIGGKTCQGDVLLRVVMVSQNPGFAVCTNFRLTKQEMSTNSGRSLYRSGVWVGMFQVFRQCVPTTSSDRTTWTTTNSLQVYIINSWLAYIEKQYYTHIYIYGHWHKYYIKINYNNQWW